MGRSKVSNTNRATPRGYFANVYDASAGLMTKRHSDEILSPDEILQFQGHPDKKFEIAIPDESTVTKLPSSELLKVLHYYISCKYFKNKEKQNYRFIDETGLIAMGIVIEEWIKEFINSGNIDEEHEKQELKKYQSFIKNNRYYKANHLTTENFFPLKIDTLQKSINYSETFKEYMELKNFENETTMESHATENTIEEDMNEDVIEENRVTPEPNIPERVSTQNVINKEVIKTKKKVKGKIKKKKLKLRPKNSKKTVSGF